jgi:hypothetical protein
MISLNKEEEIFRLAAVLYKDGNYEVSKENTLKKIVKAIFLENDNTPKTVSEIINAIFENYSLNFSENEIETVIEKSANFFQIIKLQPKKYNLIEKDYIKLKNKIKEKDLNFYIYKYLEDIKSKNLEQDKNKILHFLYDIFTKNLENYNFFMHLNNDIFSNLSKFTNSEVEDINLINGFFKYESSEKDKIIFDIVSLSLEYCLLASPKELNRRQISDKIFFLDSNVIYRAIGLNGEERKNLTLQFIKRCNDYGIVLKILNITENEFKDSIKYRTNRISHTDNVKTSKTVFQKYSSDEMYLYYYSWKEKRVNATSREFENFIFSEYENLKKKNNITVEYKNNIDYLDNNEMRNIKDEILAFKNTPISSNGEIIAKYDTQMILSLLEIRKKSNDINKKILNINNFLISTDQQLKEWTFQKRYEQAIILLPSEWMTIMFRFLGRTSNDYKSFVSFLNLKNKEETTYSAEMIHIILAGVSEMTQDINRQEFYAEQIIEHDILEIMQNKDSKDEIINKVKNYVKIDMDSKLKDITQEKNEIKKDFEKTKEKNKELTDKLLKSWKRKGYYMVFLLMIEIIFLGEHFFWQESNWNLYKKLSDYISTLNDASQNFFFSLDYAITIGIIIFSFKFCYDRLSPNSKEYLEKLNEYKDN